MFSSFWRSCSMVAASAFGGTLISSMPTNAPRPNGKLMVVRSQFFRRMKRLVVIAKGMIGRPDSRASMIMPRPATRERPHHLLEGADAPFAMKRRAVIAGAADGADPEPFDGDGVEFAVAMPRDQ